MEACNSSSSEAVKGPAMSDFDGTLIPCDSQVLFSSFVISRHPWRRLLMLVYLFALPLAMFGKWGELKLKRLFLIYLWGLQKTQIEQYAAAFVDTVIRPLLLAPVLERLKNHQAAGDYCVLVTASPSVYAEEIGRQLRFDSTLSTTVEYGETFPFLPCLPFGNNKKEAKITRLEKMNILPWQGKWGAAYAYSDSCADLPMLRAAGSCVLVNPSDNLTQQLDNQFIVLILKKPWRSRAGKIWFLCRKFFVF